MNRFYLPIKLVNLKEEGYHILVQIEAFSNIHWVVIDTGASRSVFDKTFLEKNSVIEYQTDEEVNAATLFSSSTTNVAEIPLLNIGVLEFNNYLTVSLDLSAVSTTYQQYGYPPIAGILGGDILIKYKAIINYEDLTLSLSDEIQF